MSGADWETCRRKPVVHIHGTQDYTVLYDRPLNNPWESAGHCGGQAIANGR